MVVGVVGEKGTGINNNNTPPPSFERNIRLAMPKELSFPEPPDAWNVGSLSMDNFGGIIAPNSRLESILLRFRRMQSQLKSWEEEETNNDCEVLPATDLSKLDRKIWIITTAALPWMTGWYHGSQHGGGRVFNIFF